MNGTNGESPSLPYLGVASALREAKLLDTYNTGVYLSLSTDPSLEPVSLGRVFTLPKQHLAGPTMSNRNITVPVIMLGLSMGTRIIRVDVQSAAGRRKEILGSIVDYSRYWQARGSWSTSWDGQLSNRRYVPPRRYRFLVSVLRIFGDPENPDDWERVQTVDFRIRYA